MKKQQRSTQADEAFTRLAVLKALETGDLEGTAATFNMDEDWLDGQRRQYLELAQRTYYPEPTVTETSEKSGWQAFKESYAYQVLVKICFTAVLGLVFWALPYGLRPFFDPLTNTIIWAGFTALYLLCFGSVGIELVLFAMHRVNFDFFNPYVDRNGKNDYRTLLKSDDLTAFQKCSLNQQKYVAYFALFCFLVYALLNQFQGQTG